MSDWLLGLCICSAMMFPCEVLQRPSEAAVSSVIGLCECPFSRPLRRTTASFYSVFYTPSSYSGSVQALLCLFPAPSTLASAVTWGPALWIDTWCFCFLPWNRGWTFYPMPLLCRLNFFFQMAHCSASAYPVPLRVCWYAASSGASSPFLAQSSDSHRALAPLLTT